MSEVSNTLLALADRLDDYAQALNTSLLDSVIAELRALAAPQVEMVSDEMVGAAVNSLYAGFAGERITLPPTEIVRLIARHALQAALNARAGGDGGMVERMYQALWFAQPFIAYAAKNAENPRLAKECLTAMNASIEEYRALASQAVGVKDGR